MGIPVMARYLGEPFVLPGEVPARKYVYADGTEGVAVTAASLCQKVGISARSGPAILESHMPSGSLARGNPGRNWSARKVTVLLVKLQYVPLAMRVLADGSKARRDSRVPVDPPKTADRWMMPATVTSIQGRSDSAFLVDDDFYHNERLGIGAWRVTAPETQPEEWWVLPADGVNPGDKGVGPFPALRYAVMWGQENRGIDWGSVTTCLPSHTVCP